MQNDLINEQSEVAQALLVYLGATLDHPGYKPTPNDLDRLKNYYPGTWQSLIADIDQVLSKTANIGVDWELHPWPKEAGQFLSTELAKDYPWMDQAVRDSIAAYVIYQWK